MRPHPDQDVVDWVSTYPKVSLFTTAITEAEILFGVSILPIGKRKTALTQAGKGIFNKDFNDVYYHSIQILLQLMHQ